MAYNLEFRAGGIFRRLSWNASNSLLTPKMFARKLNPDSPHGIMDSLTNSYVTPTLWLQDNRGGIAGIKMFSNVIIHSRTLFYVENYVRLSDFFANWSQGGSCNPKKLHQTKRALWRKPLRQSWRRKTLTKNKSPCYTLEVYDEKPTFVPMKITEDVV